MDWKTEKRYPFFGLNQTEACLYLVAVERMSWRLLPEKKGKKVKTCASVCILFVAKFYLLLANILFFQLNLAFGLS